MSKKVAATRQNFPDFSTFRRLDWDVLRHITFTGKISLGEIRNLAVHGRYQLHYGCLPTNGDVGGETDQSYLVGGNI